MIFISEITSEKLESGELKKELPKFYELKRVIENNSWHDNESTFTHTLNVLKKLKQFMNDKKNTKVIRYLDKKVDNHKRKDLLFLASVFHDLGKKETIVKDGKISSFPKHEKISVLKTKKVLRKFDLTKREQNIVLKIIEGHSNIHSIVEKDNKKLVTQIQKIKKSSQDFFVELIIMVMIDTIASQLKKNLPQEYKFRINFYKEKLK